MRIKIKKKIKRNLIQIKKLQKEDFEEDCRNSEKEEKLCQKDAKKGTEIEELDERMK